MFKININILEYAKTLIKWVFFASLVGILGGVIGSLFHESIDYVTTLREKQAWLIFLLPFGGMLIVLMYKLFKRKGSINTDRVIEAASGDEKVPFIMMPLIFVSSTITHLLGGSAGREGAALQIGGSIGYRIGKFFKLDENDRHIIVMTGMSAVFSAVFGTPLTAAIFSIEVISVGVFHYAALFPCIIASLLGKYIAFLFGITPFEFNDIVYTQISFKSFSSICIIAIICALISSVFCYSIKKAEYLSQRFVKNGYIRGFVGGVIIILLTVLVGSFKYNGAGMDTITSAIGGDAAPEDFILKLIFTVITVSAGFKGGEIIPAFFIGSTLGCVLAETLGISPSDGAVVGIISLFCGITNCPISSLILAIEAFGDGPIWMYSIVCAISYVLSGYSGLYKSQKIIYSKTTDEFINKNVK